MSKNELVYFKGRNGRAYDIQEAEANIFAESLLIPEDKLKETIQSERSVKKLADIFNVPKMAMIRRLRYLGYNII